MRIAVGWVGMAMLAMGGCAQNGPSIANPSFEIVCGAGSCNWDVVEGTVEFHGTWHPGDVGLDMSGEGTAVVEQRDAFAPPSNRDYLLEATVLRDATASVTFELAWYGYLGNVTDYWERSPRLQRVDQYAVGTVGLTRF